MVCKKVLLATDFSQSAKQLVDCVENLKIAGLEEVVLVHIINTSGLFGLKNYSEQRLVEKKYEVEDELEKEENALKDLGLEVEAIVSAGSPADKIVEFADLKDVDLILISSFAKGYIKEIFLGSTTFDVIRTSETPIWVEKYKEVNEDQVELFAENRFKKVLIPTDFSKRVNKVLTEVKRASEFIEEVVILSVIERNINKEQLERLTKHRKKVLNEIKNDLKEAGIKTKAKISAGVASRNILELAEKEDVTMIMMPTRGSGTVKGLMIGSTTNAVVRGSKKPLLIFPS